MNQIQLMLVMMMILPRLRLAHSKSKGMYLGRCSTCGHREQVPRLLSATAPTPTESVREATNPTAQSKYVKDDIDKILGVGRKIKDDDEEDIEPLDEIEFISKKCRQGSRYRFPYTKVIVKWKDGHVSLENGTAIWAALKGTGDSVIYQRAKAQEEKYRQHLDDVESDEEESGQAESHQHHSFPPLDTTTFSQKIRPGFGNY
jgi:hypothetical protein